MFIAKGCLVGTNGFCNPNVVNICNRTGYFHFVNDCILKCYCKVMIKRNTYDNKKMPCLLHFELGNDYGHLLAPNTGFLQKSKIGLVKTKND